MSCGCPSFHCTCRISCADVKDQNVSDPFYHNSAVGQQNNYQSSTSSNYHNNDYWTPRAHGHRLNSAAYHVYNEVVGNECDILPSTTAPAFMASHQLHNNTTETNVIYPFSPLSGDLFQPEEIFQLDQPIKPPMECINASPPTLLDLNNGTIGHKLSCTNRSGQFSTEVMSDSFYNINDESTSSSPHNNNNEAACFYPSTTSYNNEYYGNCDIGRAQPPMGPRSGCTLKTSPNTPQPANEILMEFQHADNEHYSQFNYKGYKRKSDLSSIIPQQGNNSNEYCQYSGGAPSNSVGTDCFFGEQSESVCMATKEAAEFVSEYNLPQTSVVSQQLAALQQRNSYLPFYSGIDATAGQQSTSIGGGGGLPANVTYSISVESSQ